MLMMNTSTGPEVSEHTKLSRCSCVYLSALPHLNQSRRMKSKPYERSWYPLDFSCYGEHHG